jgi:hypothetical protein
MADNRIVAIFQTDLAEAQGIIDELELDAKAKVVGRFVAVWGPFVDELGPDGVAEVARSKNLPLVEVRKREAKAHASHARV